LSARPWRGPRQQPFGPPGAMKGRAKRAPRGRWP